MEHLRLTHRLCQNICQRSRGIARPVVSLFLLLTLSGTLASCGSPKSLSYQMPDAADLSQMTWTAAFQQLNEKISREYAFTDWKGVDWKALYDSCLPRIQQAQAANDFRAYYLALREYVFSIPDGHVMIRGDDRGILAQEVGGGFGVVAMQLDDSRIVAARVTGGSPAALAGMQAGAELLQWNGKPVGKALAETSVLFAHNPPATQEGINYEKLRFLTRAPVGASSTVTFRNRDEAAAQSVTLTAVDDGMETLSFSNPFYDFSIEPQSVVEMRMLPGNVGYIYILAELDLIGETPTAELFRNTVQSCIDSAASGIVIDVRKNIGGMDSMVAGFLSSFYKDRTLYEYQNCYNQKSGKMGIWMIDDDTGEFGHPGEGLYIEPGSSVYSGPVVVMVNPGCISSGEGVAMGIRNLPNGKVVAFWGTHGSFGIAGDIVLMPGEITIKFPFGQSLDKNKSIQLDSRNLVGGVSPNARVPMTLENALKWGAGEDVELGYALDVLGQMGRGE